MVKRWVISFIVVCTTSFFIQTGRATTSSDYQAMPPFVTAGGVPPLLMLVMGRNHKLYYEAYNDASDLNQDGVLDVGYDPTIDYYGYFDSYKCYVYDSDNKRFKPSSKTTDKTVNASNEWSGDFLNYITMSRIDTLRKVLYGGHRSVDTATETVLERSFIPRDAHAWGKEYYSQDHDGYDIRDYTPLELPPSGTRHLFANTTLDSDGDNSGYDDPPLLRVLPNNTHRIWDWVSSEAPTVGTGLESSGTTNTTHPSSHTTFEELLATFATPEHKYDEGTAEWINGSGNPHGSDDHYFTVFEGKLKIPTGSGGIYEFAVDGDDAVEVIIDGTVVAYWYEGHGKCSCKTHNGSINLTEGTHTIKFHHEEVTGGDNYYLYWKRPSSSSWEIVPKDAFNDLTQTTYDKKTASSEITDYVVRVVVCDPSVGLESNSKEYDKGKYKPIGILQRYGEANRMFFGLMTGSYTKNTSGGVLRKNIGSIKQEINLKTGQFYHSSDSTMQGIIPTIDRLRIDGYTYNGYSYNENCGWIANRAISEGNCRMWGNPVAEMMYETLRYFSGATSPTAEFTYGTDTSLDDNQLGLSHPSWRSPYAYVETNNDLNGNGKIDSGFDYCARPFMLVLSDIYPNFDSDQLPGSPYGSSSTSLGTLDVELLAQKISLNEGENNRKHFIGQAEKYDGACTEKTVDDLGNIRGLCPEEPTKQGSYYSASVAYYGAVNDVNSNASSDQTVGTYCVGLASPFPDIKIKVGTGTITLVPFGKSVGGGYSISADKGKFQPTNTIVDFFVDTITDTYGKFLINFEDVEQGADHDMDANVEFEYQVQDAAGNPVTDPANGVKVKISLNSFAAAGSIIQHIGYIISGSTADGTYLEVRDYDTGESSDPDYFLDTPPGQYPGGNWDDDTYLPLKTSRTFEPGATAATLMTNPLWYAAKWGGFEDYNDNNLPDQANEWDKNEDGIPDTYFYVQNPLKLEEQLNRSFADILSRTSSGTAASVVSQTRSGEGAVYQAVFTPEFKGPMGNATVWTGAVNALLVDGYGNMREDTNGNHQLNLAEDRIIVFNNGVVEKYIDTNGNGYLDHEDLDGDGVLDPGEDQNGNNVLDEETSGSGIPVSTGDINDIDFLWSSSEWLNEMSDSEIESQRIYTSASPNRYIFTFADANENGIADSGEVVDFTTENLSSTTITNTSTPYPYLNIFPTYTNEPDIDVSGEEKSLNSLRSNSALFQDLVVKQTARVIDYIRGVDQDKYTSGTYNYVLPAFRSRKVDYDDDYDGTDPDTMETWRLGDIVYSTPTMVGKPAENYHLIYGDSSYANFLYHYQYRRHVIYTGANDGMFHAFNGGFYDASDSAFRTFNDANGNDTYDTGEGTKYPLGSELWAYIPYNLLPHLYWLTETSYPHVYYCDLKPKVFDAKILPDDTHYTDSDTEPNWGTFVISGMRFGGGEIQADMDKTSGNTADINEDTNNNGVLDTDEDVDGDGVLDKLADRTMTSAYFLLDITDPEKPPTLIAEFSFPNLGYTTCYPSVIPMKNKDAAGVIHDNDWYLVFGSGPADSTGKADTLNALSSAESKQSAKLYVVDLKKLTGCKDNGTKGTPTLVTVKGNGETDYFQSLDTNAFVSDPVTVDYDMDFSADAVYFGTVSSTGSSTWGGKMRRIKINDRMDPDDWDGDSVLFDAGAPITAAASVGMDELGKRWIYFGTGRFFVTDDKPYVSQQTYYGIIEPFSDENDNNYMDANEPMSWGTATQSQLLNVSSAKVFSDQSVTGIGSLTNWGQLTGAIDDTEANNGWYINFSQSGERNLGQATLLGDLLTFTTYIPSSDICQYSGTSNLYAVYYKTGTAFYESVIGTNRGDNDSDPDEIIREISLGTGLAVTPNLHIGLQEGSRAFIQTSTGDILTLDQANPGAVKSGVRSWRKVE